MEAIILAGGLGTRLRAVVDEVPKCMAPILGRPFLEYLLDHLIQEGIERVILSIGYMADDIQDYFGESYQGCEIVYAIEEELLGTGGAIQFAIQKANSEQVFVFNGDSFYNCKLKSMLSFHIDQNAEVSIALNPMNNVSRYGTVVMDEAMNIESFREKQPLDYGLVNTGVYIFNKSIFETLDLPNKFSIEKDFFEPYIEKLNFKGYTKKAYFLDIGIPKDYQKAQYEIGVFPYINKSWTLFLDRDGVINRKRDNDYVKNVDEFEFLPGALDAIAYFSKIFGRIIIVTNQQGVGKGLMTAADLEQVHVYMKDKVIECGGRIDSIYYAPQLKEENSQMRKPNIGMAIQAKTDFPEIDFKKSIMVGDSYGDMEFAERAEMYKVYINEAGNDNLYRLPSLEALANTMNKLI